VKQNCLAILIQLFLKKGSERRIKYVIYYNSKKSKLSDLILYIIVAAGFLPE
jgi:hypothetical protein